MPGGDESGVRGYAENAMVLDGEMIPFDSVSVSYVETRN